MFTVYMDSMFGREEFPYDTQEEALAGIARLVAKVEELDDGIQRFIGFIVNLNEDE